MCAKNLRPCLVVVFSLFTIVPQFPTTTRPTTIAARVTRRTQRHLAAARRTTAIVYVQTKSDATLAFVDSSQSKTRQDLEKLKGPTYKLRLAPLRGTKDILPLLPGGNETKTLSLAPKFHPLLLTCSSLALASLWLLGSSHVLRTVRTYVYVLSKLLVGGRSLFRTHIKKTSQT